jgi:hypothetical protein
MAAKTAKLQTIDLWTEHKELFRPKAGKPELVRVLPLAYLMVDGKGDPNTSPDFRNAIGALYSLAYTLKFMLKKRKIFDFRVMPLSGRYHNQDPRVFLQGRKQEWQWTLMLPIPSAIGAAQIKEARELALARKNPSPALPRVRREVLREGLCAQVLHIGPYAAEAASIEALHAFIAEKGLTFAGSHHEIYLSDPNRTAPEKLKTIVRQPVKKA